MKTRPTWQLLLLLGTGIFIGSFWILYGFLSVVGASAAWWYYALALTPGCAILSLVLMARRYPMPYGTGLIFLGSVPLFITIVQGGPVAASALLGVPVALLGLLFVLWRRNIRWLEQD